MKASIAAAFFEAEVVVSRDMDDDTQLEVEGYVRWDPVAQEHRVADICIKKTATWTPDNEAPGTGYYEPKMGGDFCNEREEEKAKDALIAEAEREHIGECTACLREWGPKSKADGADWLCTQHREQLQKRRAA